MNTLISSCRSLAAVRSHGRRAALAAVSLWLFASTAQASNLDFQLLNETNQPIVALWASPTDDPDWERFDNVFVPSDGQQRVHFVDGSGGYGRCLFDVKVMFAQGHTEWFTRVNLCSVQGMQVFVDRGDVKASTW